MDDTNVDAGKDTQEKKDQSGEGAGAESADTSAAGEATNVRDGVDQKTGNPVEGTK